MAIISVFGSNGDLDARILRIAEQAGFNFSLKIQGRFMNPWAGVYICPERKDINEISAALYPSGFNLLAE